MRHSHEPQILYDFNSDKDPRDWYSIDDVVMGGRSSGQYSIDSEGVGVFEGYVSLENNGGFASIRHELKPEISPEGSTVKIRLKGDGQKYQFRVKHELTSYYSYVYSFETTGDWQTIEFPLTNMYASFRGRTLDIPNFDQNQIAEIGFLIGNKKEGSFRLILDKIKID